MRMPKPMALVCSTVVLVTACKSSPEPTPPPPPAPSPTAEAAPAAPGPKAALGTFGFDAAGVDPTVKPGDDFFRFSGGAWMKSEVMPSDRSRWGTFDKLRAKAEADVKALIEDVASKPAEAGTVEAKIGDFYRSFNDVDAIEKAGLAPAQATLDAMAKAKDHAALVALGSKPDVPTQAPIGFAFTLDEKNPDRYIIGVGHSGLGLGEREYYLKTDDDAKKLVAEYTAHIARVLKLLGEPKADGVAKQIVAFETEIAKLHWPIAKRRERELTYNLKTRAELEKLAPEWPWKAMFDASGLSAQPEFVVAEVDTLAPLAKLFKKTPIGTLRAYTRYHYLHGVASVLPKAWDDEFFAFYGKTLNGQPEQRARWKRAVEAIDGALGEAVGQVYVTRHFTADAKTKMVDLVENLRKAYGQRIDALTWMSAETKVVAREKLASFRVKVGYPDSWRDYGALEVKAGDAFGNMVRAKQFSWAHDLARLPKPTDKGEWGMTPQTVNAYYNPVWNEIVFPAAILQPPFFDPNADPAVNYGAIGGVIGHEMGHGFDDQGAKSDAKGVLRTWWNAADEASFKKLVDALVAQYDQFEPLPGLKVNGRFTAGENIGDNGGLAVAHEAYRLSLGGKDAAVLDGFNGDQRFFHGWAQVWRTLIREQRLRNQVMTDPHSPGEFRVNGVVRNLDAWYTAFDVKPGDKLYLPPEQRVHIW
jgi:putative endopeptidase